MSYVLGIDTGPRGIHAAIADGGRSAIRTTTGTDPATVVEAVIREEGRRPREIRIVGADLPGATRVERAVAVAHRLGGASVVVCDGPHAALVRDGEIVARHTAADTLSALTAALAGAEDAAIALTGPARHAEARVRRRFGRAEAIDDDAAAIGAATLPSTTDWTAPPSGFRLVAASSWASPEPPGMAGRPEDSSPSAESPGAAAEPPADSPDASAESPSAAAEPPADSPDAAAVVPRRRRRRRVIGALAALVLLAGLAAAFVLKRPDPVVPSAACQAAMDDGSDEGIQRACDIVDYVPAGSTRCDWYIAAGEGTDCAVATEAFAAWFADRASDFDCEGEFILSCRGPGGRRAYVMRALDLLR